MNTEEFRKIDGQDQGYALHTQEEQALIELDIEALSIEKVLFLQNFIERLLQRQKAEEAGVQQQQQIQQ